jgi:predicted nucleic acid-binding protein
MLDTNVLVYAIDARDPAKQATAQEAIRTLAENGRGMLCAQVLGEYFRVVTQRIEPTLTKEVAERRLLTLSLSFPVFDTTMESIRDGARLASQFSLGFWDAVIVSVAKANGASVLLTEDHIDNRVVEGVRYLNPFDANFDMALLR